MYTVVIDRIADGAGLPVVVVGEFRDFFSISQIIAPDGIRGQKSSEPGREKDAVGYPVITGILLLENLIRIVERRIILGIPEISLAASLKFLLSYWIAARYVYCLASMPEPGSESARALSNRIRA